MATCTACGAPRPPFSTRGINTAGQSGKIGGAITNTLGWLILIFGLALTWAAVSILQFIAPGVGYVVGIPMGLIVLGISIFMILGGSKWRKSGETAAHRAKLEAVFAMAWHRGGAVTVRQVAQALRMGEGAADALLTEITKAFGDYASLEVDEQGGLFYRVKRPGEDPAERFGIKYRVEADGSVSAIDQLAEVSQLEDDAPQFVSKNRRQIPTTP